MRCAPRRARPRGTGEQSQGAMTAFPRIAPARGRTSRARRAAATPVPQVRWDRVWRAQARIASGYYDRPDVRERVVDAMLAELSRPA